MSALAKRRRILFDALLLVVLIGLSGYSINQYYAIQELIRRVEVQERGARALKASYSHAGYYLYVPNTLDGTVSIIDLLGNRVVGTIIVGIRTSDGIASSPDGRYVYAGSSETREIAIIDTSNNTVVSSIGIDEPFIHGIDVSPNGKQLWVVGEKTTVVDMSTRSVVKQFPIWSMGHVDFSRDGRYAYMTTLEAFGAKKDLVVAFDTATLEIYGQAEVRDSPNEVELSPDSSLIYVANYGSDDVTILDRELKIVASVPAGRGAHGLAISPDGMRLYVANRKTDYVSVIDTVNRRELARVRVGSGPNHIVASPDGTLIYVSNIGSADITIVDTHSLTVIGGIRVGKAPHEIEIVRLYEVETQAS